MVGKIHAEGLCPPAGALEFCVSAGNLSDLVKSGKLLLVAPLVVLRLLPSLHGAAASLLLASCLVVKQQHLPWEPHHFVQVDFFFFLNK